MAENQKRKPKPKPTTKMTQAEQSERFKETARELGVDESGEEFERAFRRISPPKTPRSPAQGEAADDDDAAATGR